MSDALPEPWLRGQRLDAHPVIAPVLHALQQAREDLYRFTESLSDAEIWSRSHQLAPVGFHLRHIAESVDRLTTYLSGGTLTEAQLASLAFEKTPGASREELLSGLNASFTRFEETVRSIDPATFADTRFVGRQRLPTSVVGLLIHIAEHTQRHVGQAITMSQLMAAKKNGS